MTERRPGDLAVLVSSNEKAVGGLGWNLYFSDLNTIIESAWNWHK